MDSDRTDRITTAQAMHGRARVATDVPGRSILTAPAPFAGQSPAQAVAAGAVVLRFSSHRARDRAGVAGMVGQRRGCRACYSFDRSTGKGGAYVVPAELAVSILAPVSSGWRAGRRPVGVARLRGPYADLCWCWDG